MFLVSIEHELFSQRAFRLGLGDFFIETAKKSEACVSRAQHGGGWLALFHYVEHSRDKRKLQPLMLEGHYEAYEDTF